MQTPLALLKRPVQTPLALLKRPVQTPLALLKRPVQTPGPSRTAYSSQASRYSR